MKEKIRAVEMESRPYNALRFVSFLAIALGWMFIITGIALTLFMYDKTTAAFMDAYLPAEIDTTKANIISIIFLFFQWVIIGVLGSFIIASGQVWLVLLDIRDATRDQKEYMRLLLKNLSPPK